MSGRGGGRGGGGRGDRPGSAGRGGRGGRDGGRGGRDGGRGGRDGGRDGGGRGGGRDGGGRGGRDGGGRGRGRGAPRDDGPIPDQQAMQTLQRMMTSMSLRSTVNVGLPTPDPAVPEKYKFARRPDPGTKGTPCKVVTNYYSVSKYPTGYMMHYHFEVVQKKFDRATGEATVLAPEDRRALPARVMKDVVTKVAQQCKWKAYAYDGRANIYAPQQLLQGQQLEGGKLLVHVELPHPKKPDARRRYEASIQLVKRLEMQKLAEYMTEAGQDMLFGDVQPQLQAMEVILNHAYMMDDRQLYITRTFFKADQRGFTVGSGGEAWIGYKQDLRPCRFGLGLSIEPSFSVFYEGKPVIQYVEAVLSEPGRPYRWSERGMSPTDIKKASKELKGLTVINTSDSRKYRCKGLSARSAKDYGFSLSDGTTMTVATYFARKHNFKLKYPELPCVEMQDTDRRSKNKEGPKRGPVAVPMELLELMRGQKRRALLIGDQQSNLVRFAAQDPAKKLSDIRTWNAETQAAWRPVLKHFGMEIGTEITTVKARLLPPPTLEYGRPTSYFAGTQGNWNMEGFKFKKPQEIKSWGICVLMPDRELRGEGPGSLSHWVNMMSATFKDLGMAVPPQKPLVHFCGQDLGRAPAYEAIETHIEQTLDLFQGLPHLLFLIIPRKDPNFYKMIKGACDSQYGVISQVIVAGKASCLTDAVNRGERGYSQNNHKQYLANVGLKVNHKLGGINNSVKGLGTFQSHTPTGQPTCPPIWNNKPTMLIGIDVSHPQSFDKAEPSMVGIVASMDKAFAQYACRIKRVGHRQEVVEEMKEDIMELLRTFYLRNKVKPEAIVVYRDGVSIGEFSTALVKEYNAIRAACREMGDPSAEYCPPITYITVLKRHKARLFPGDDVSRDHQKGNVKPGICVDDGVVLKHGFDFYLNSQLGIQGTVKPAHYHVLCDENGFGSDAIQIATYWLCYTFCRCTRSVSYCPPAYYAHRAADRGRILLHRDPSADTASTATSEDGDPNSVHFYPVNDALKDRMFFV